MWKWVCHRRLAHSGSFRETIQQWNGAADWRMRLFRQKCHLKYARIFSLGENERKRVRLTEGEKGGQGFLFEPWMCFLRCLISLAHWEPEGQGMHHEIIGSCVEGNPEVRWSRWAAPKIWINYPALTFKAPAGSVELIMKQSEFN